MELLQELQDKGFKVSVVNGDTLKIVPGSKLTPELTERLKTKKPALIKALSAELPPDNYDRHIESAIAEFNSYGIRYTDIPEANRRRADKIEKEMNEAANCGDWGMFLKALKQWRACFH